jgi:hypothetical protein
VNWVKRWSEGGGFYTFSFSLVVGSIAPMLVKMMTQMLPMVLVGLARTRQHATLSSLQRIALPWYSFYLLFSQYVVLSLSAYVFGRLLFLFVFLSLTRSIDSL